MMTRAVWLGLALGAAVVAGSANAAAGHPEDHGGSLVGSWVFTPRYMLPREASNPLGPHAEPARVTPAALSSPSAPLLLFGEEPTERRVGLTRADQLPRAAFSVELWTVDHVNQPVGALAAHKSAAAGQAPAWTLYYYDGAAAFRVASESGAAVIEAPIAETAFKGYWRHIVGVYDGDEARLYVNGELVGRDATAGGALRVPEQSELEIAAYTHAEPWMGLGNIVHEARLLEGAVGEDAVRARYGELCGLVERGVLYPDLFHFSAGPYLNMATPDGIRILWETDRPATGIVEYGRTASLGQTVAVEEAARLQSVQLSGLEEAAPYFYRVQARDEAGAVIDSGLLTFKTGIGDDGGPFSFVVIGDTEARPHVNDRLAKAVWDERPDFVVNCGDLTDGGKEPHKFEWNYEYFLGMTQLHSRVPAFPVPGNGEGDLYWYRRFHDLPAQEGYYSFRYGNAEFFMLDSNRRSVDFQPGGRQFEWLRERLEASDATWKFVAHHHPPYTSDEDDYGDSWREPSNLGDPDVRRMTGLYEKHGVDIVFYGHLHTYERSWPLVGGRAEQGGVVYVQAGGAGGNLEDFAPTRSWFKNKTYRGHHYCTVDIMDNVLQFRMYDLDGRMRDSFELAKRDRVGLTGVP